MASHTIRASFPQLPADLLRAGASGDRTLSRGKAMRGCDWVAIRNLTITLGILTGFATSSAIFALNWHHWAPEGPWNILVTKISYSAAATWALSALVILGILMAVASSFCSCSASSSACVTFCGFLTAALRTLLGALVGLFALCTVAAADDELSDNPAFMFGLFAAFAVCASAMTMIGIAAVLIATCQP